MRCRGDRRKLRIYRFSFDEAKSEVVKELQAILPSSVKRIMKEPTYDSFVANCLLYFIVTFQRELLQKGLEKARKQHMDSYDPVAAVAKVASLEQEAARLKAGLSPLYAMVWIPECLSESFPECLHVRSIPLICPKACTCDYRS